MPIVSLKTLKYLLFKEQLGALSKYDFNENLNYEFYLKLNSDSMGVEKGNL